MFNYQEALEKINAVATKLPTITVPTNKTLNCICAENITSPEALPPFHNAAMDGYALRSQDTQSVSEQHPAFFNIIGCVGAGDTLENVVTDLSYTACEIMTGASIPEGYDAVVRLEDVTLTAPSSTEQKIKHGKVSQQISLNRPVMTKENIRFAAEDIAKGVIMIEAGEIIKPHHMMALAAVGIQYIKIRQKPQVALICTGKELVDVGEASLKPGKIHNSNGPYLQAMLPSMGVEIQSYFTLPDEPKKFTETLQDILNCPKPPDIIITTGGVSMGRWDFIPDALQALKAETLFHRVKIRPGKPVLFAQLKQTYLFGLPGNPIAVAVGLRFFAYPLIRKLVGLNIEQPLRANLLADYCKKPGLRLFAKGKAYINKHGIISVEVLQGQESFKIIPLLKANCWIELPEDRAQYKKDEIINIYPLDSNSFLPQIKEKIK